ncbi:hypothetical protein Vafri_9776 [Volvox africanus]|uniref:SGNH hydrolase-type esterase domain-containing protein n=1 Tax=Volvox africanus TaxID=51714 RepID=A0A8J4B5K2_9CHLO|nr:hypothetical protein Vafri_9776 [Volvox africanus]
MVPIREFLFILLAFAKLPLSISYQYATSPRIENLTDTEIKYANIYWYYDPAARVVHSDKTYNSSGRPSASGPQISLDYRFVVPLAERLAGLAYVGHAARLHLVLERARNGQPLIVGALGGSITYGQSVGGWKGSYVKIFTDWLNAAMPPHRQPRGRAAEEGNATATEASAQSGSAATNAAVAAPLAAAQRTLKGLSPITSVGMAAVKRWDTAASTRMAEGAGGRAGDGVSKGLQRQKHNGVLMRGFGAGRAVAGAADSDGSGGSRRQQEQVVRGESGQAGAASTSISTSSAAGLASAAAVENTAAAGAIRGQAAAAEQGMVTASTSRKMLASTAAVTTGTMLDTTEAMEATEATDATETMKATDATGGTKPSTEAAAPQGGGGTGSFSGGHTGSWRRQPLRHDFLNGAVPGTQSAYMSSCMRYHLPPAVDIVFVEYAANDSPAPRWTFADPCRRSLERLFRKLLNLPSQPAVVLVNMYAIGAARGKYLHTAERDFMEFATYYSLPAVRPVQGRGSSRGVTGAQRTKVGRQ